MFPRRPDSRRFGMRSARRRASRALDGSCLDLGRSLRVLLSLPFNRAGGPLGLGRLPLTLLLELLRLPAHQFVKTQLFMRGLSISKAPLFLRVVAVLHLYIVGWSFFSDIQL